MERNKIEDLQSDNCCNSNSAQITNNTRLTPGKFSDLSETDKNISAMQNYDDENTNINNFYLYSTNIDTNAIWNTNKDLKRSYSLPSQALYAAKTEAKDGHETLNSIWNSKYSSNESLPPIDDVNGSYRISEISIDINDFENIDSTELSKAATNDREKLIIPKEPKDNYTSEENKKIVSMINSHEGWGVKPVNQKTPWDIPDADSNNNENYQDTFSNWFNEAPNGVCVWDSYETAKKQSISDWSNAVKGKTNNNYAMTQPKTVWSTVANDSIWSNSTTFNNCGVVGSTKMNYGTSANFSAMDINNAVYPTPSRLPTTKATNEKIKGTCWPNDVNKVAIDFKALSSSCSVDRYTAPRPKHMENEVANLKLYKDAQKQLIEQYHKDLRKIQEIDNNLVALSKLPEIQARPILTELIRQRQTILQRSHNLQSQLEAVSHRVNQIEEIISSYSRATYGSVNTVDTKYCSQSSVDTITTKMESIKLQQSMDFRPDVPEFIPGKKWYGLAQNGKENRNPTNITTKIGGTSSSSVTGLDIQDVNNYSTWLLIQNLPSHISIDMIQSFFTQNNNPCVTPIHSNPFSRWVLVKFPNHFSSQKAFHLLSGKVGQVSLISDQEANLKLQELKGVMARFVAH